jgi:hypothetical protein
VTAENAALALDYACRLAPLCFDRDDRFAEIVEQTVKAAGKFYQLLEGPNATARLVITAEVDGAPVALITPPGGTMPQLVNATDDNNTVTLTAAEADDHNQPTSDQLVWTNDDTASAVATWELSADTKTYTGTLTHTEGTVNITITDPSAPNLSPTVVQLVVGAGATSQINVSAVVA